MNKYLVFRKRLIASGIGILLTASLAACGTSKGSSNDTTTEAVTSVTTEAVAEKTEEVKATKTSVETEEVSENTTSITLADEKDITITEAGTYYITGSAKNCTIRVEADKENDKVNIVLDGVNIENTSKPCIYVVSADKTIITTKSASILSVTGTIAEDGDTTPDAVIYAKDDLKFNGDALLTVDSSEADSLNAITGKDDIKFEGGEYAINSSKNAVRANDSIEVSDGTFTINATDDGLHAENNDDDSVGNIEITGGTFNIKAGDDGLHATTTIVVSGGEINVEAAEGFEATQIEINDGNITINSSDDGINAAHKSSALSPLITFNGGNTTITMGAGDTDAVDANGDIVVNDGIITITAPTSSFDYDGSGTINGGTVTINGEVVTSMPANMMMGGPGQGGQMGNQMGNQMGGPGQRP
ncbi:MAG: carbohydrate-binding domain-containing protein [Eubacterium sp.]|nr:carbohydrate-binding domain-containing protein [Eubacterium sp.]